MQLVQELVVGLIKTSDKYDEEMTMEMDQAFDLDQMRLSGNLETFPDNDEQQWRWRAPEPI